MDCFILFPLEIFYLPHFHRSANGRCATKTKFETPTLIQGQIFLCELAYEKNLIYCQEVTFIFICENGKVNDLPRMKIEIL